MGKQPYTYSMPESFLKDQSVPARWRVLGIVNGFMIAGKPFYGSNKWLMEQLDCSEQTISNAFKELEELGEIETQRTRRSRFVTRKLKAPEPSETLTALGLRPETVEVSDPNQLGTISDSISESIKGVSLRSTDILEVVEVSEEDSPSKAKKDPEGRKRALYWHARCKAEFGIGPSGGVAKTMKVINNALKHLEPPQVKQMIDDWFDYEDEEPHDMIQITRCLSPYRIDKFKASL